MVAQSPSQLKALADYLNSTHQVFLNPSAIFPSETLTSDIMDRVMRLASQRAVVIFSVSSCCMCHTVKTLFCDLGVNPAVYELDEEPQGREMEKALVKILGRKPPAPVVFIGGKIVGSTDRVMSLHLEGGLVPMLRDAGALWL